MRKVIDRTIERTDTVRGDRLIKRNRYRPGSNTDPMQTLQPIEQYGLAPERPVTKNLIKIMLKPNRFHMKTVCATL